MAIEDFAAQFSAELDRAIQYAMENDVASAVRVSLAEAVETEVYDAYDPHMYIRRGPMDGGLQDQSPDNMEATYDPQTKTLEVQDSHCESDGAGKQASGGARRDSGQLRARK